MRIAVFSDIHGNQYSLKKFCEQVKTDHCDLIVFLGDVFGYYYGQHECLEMLSSMDGLVCLLGNHDQNFLDLLKFPELEADLVAKYGSSYSLKFRALISKSDINFLNTFKTRYTLFCDDLKLMFCHGSPSDNLNGRLYPDTDLSCELADCRYDFIFIGHTHHKMIKTFNKTVVANPGSIGQQRDGKGCSYLIFDSKDRGIEFKSVTFDIPALLNDIESNDPEQQGFKTVLFRKA